MNSEYTYNSNEDFANDLEEFAKSCDNSKIGFRMFCGRLYYAMFHKVVAYNKNIKGQRPKHKQIAYGITNRECQNAYRFLLDAREWADYSTQNKHIDKHKLLMQYEFILRGDLTCIIQSHKNSTFLCCVRNFIQCFRKIK